jgi:hypothetical protein
VSVWSFRYSQFFTLTVFLFYFIFFENLIYFMPFVNWK